MKYIELSELEEEERKFFNPEFFTHFRSCFGDRMKVNLDNFHTLQAGTWHLPMILRMFTPESMRVEISRIYLKEGTEAFYYAFIGLHRNKMSLVDKIVKAAYST
jgi:hypothetical protein